MLDLHVYICQKNPYLSKDFLCGIIKGSCSERVATQKLGITQHLIRVMVTGQLVGVTTTLGLFQHSMLIVAKPFSTFIRLLVIMSPSDIIEGVKRDECLRNDLFAKEII